MLESNTDRSYFMIGAVIIAAVIIGAVTFLFKDTLFGTAAAPGIVPELVDTFFNKAKTMIGGIN